jgi:hypothetical protein
MTRSMSKQKKAKLNPKPKPRVLFSICDRVAADEAAGKPNLLGPFDHVRAEVFPALVAGRLFLPVLGSKSNTVHVQSEPGRSNSGRGNDPCLSTIRRNCIEPEIATARPHGRCARRLASPGAQ